MLSMKGIILAYVRWYAASALSYRNLEDMVEERGAAADYDGRSLDHQASPASGKGLAETQTAGRRQLTNG